MEKANHKKNINPVERDEKRLTTAPIRERPKYSDLYKTGNFELPLIRGKNFIGREPVVASRDFKRNANKKQQYGKVEQDHDENHKRPQTSKGSRNCNKVESEYYEDEEDDLVVTSMHERIDILKKISKEHPCAKNQ